VNSTRRYSIATGTLFLVATASALVAGALGPDLTGPTYLADAAGHPARLAAAALFYLLAAGTSVGIAVALYPVLRTVGAGLAVGSVVFRTIEAVFYTAAVVNLMSLLPLARRVTTAPADERATLRILADSLVSQRDQMTIVAVLAFGTGALLYYVLLYRARLVPRWLSGWGVVAVLLIMTACVLSLFRDTTVTGYLPLILPIFVQEIVLGGWLLARGFTTPALAAEPPDAPASPGRTGVATATPSEG
jgi:Domain of unknown function (DUF4386)